MPLSSQLLFFVSGLGVFNGLLVGGYLLLRRQRGSWPTRLFGMMILLLTVRIGKSVFYFFEPGLPKPILQIGLSACPFIGLFLWLYVRSVLRQEKRLSSTGRAHLLAWLLIVLGIGLLFPYTSRPDLWNPRIVQGLYAVWLGYVIWTGVLLGKKFLGKNAPPSLQASHLCLLSIFGLNALICLVFHAILYVGFPSYILGPITFSVGFYGLLAFLMFHPKALGLIEGSPERYAQKEIQPQATATIKAGLRQLMEVEQRFTEPSLKLAQLAEALSVSPHLLSQYLNQTLGQRFSEYVNTYRVQAAAELLRDASKLTIEGIGQEVGFRSKSAFYEAFKKVHGMTPAQYAKQMQSA
ncbi:MAG: helix-turn-helix domain-containing protein [Bacteroidota bacterium]